MAKHTIEVECPDGWEPVAYRIPVEGEYFICARTGIIVLAPLDRPESRIIVRKSWQWPAFLKALWIAMDEDGKWYGYDEEPHQSENRRWIGVGWEKLNCRHIAFDLPRCDDWRNSKRKNPNL